MADGVKWTRDRIDAMLGEMVAKRASDIHLKVGIHPVFRIDGKLTKMEKFPVLTPQDIEDIAYHLLPYSKKGFVSAEGMGEECGYDAEGIGRFRVSIFRQRGVLSIVMRHIPSKIPNIDELNLPPVIKDLAMERRGLILVTGTTGSGKSTTLAAMIEHINLHDSRNIITIEDPIEFLFTDKKSIIAQREIGSDVENFSSALKASLRQDPDVILVGEMRDLETIETAILAAETGHLVFSTLHTLDAPETINRVISVFPPYQQEQIRIQLASVLKASISMRLVPKKGGGRVPAMEILIATAAIREAILEPEKFAAIRDLIAEGKSQYGMQTFDQSLFELYKSDLITFEEALAQCSRPDEFKLKVRGILSAAEMTKLEMEKKSKEAEKVISSDPFGSGIDVEDKPFGGTGSKGSIVRF